MCTCTYRGLGSKLLSQILACHVITEFWHSIEPGRMALTPRDDTGYAVGQVQMQICDQSSCQRFRVCPFFVKIQPPLYTWITAKPKSDL